MWLCRHTQLQLRCPGSAHSIGKDWSTHCIVAQSIAPHSRTCACHAGLYCYDLDISGVKVDGEDAEFEQRFYEQQDTNEGESPHAIFAARTLCAGYSQPNYHHCMTTQTTAAAIAVLSGCAPELVLTDVVPAAVNRQYVAMSAQTAAGLAEHTLYEYESLIQKEAEPELIIHLPNRLEDPEEIEILAPLAESEDASMQTHIELSVTVAFAIRQPNCGLHFHGVYACTDNQVRNSHMPLYMLSTMHAASCHCHWQYMPLGCSCLLWLRMQLQKLRAHQSTGTPFFAKQAKVCNEKSSLQLHA